MGQELHQVIAILTTILYIIITIINSANDTHDCVFHSQIVDAYVFLIMEEANKLEINTVYCVSCHFYSQLLKSGCNTVSNWIKVVIKLIYINSYLMYSISFSG